MTGTILKGLNKHIKILLGEHLFLVPSECEGVLPLDHDIQFLTLHASHIRELTQKIHTPVNTKGLTDGLKGRPGGGLAMRCSTNFKVCNHMTGIAAATLNDSFS
jgi:hypothetical protein